MMGKECVVVKYGLLRCVLECIRVKQRTSAQCVLGLYVPC